MKRLFRQLNIGRGLGGVLDTYQRSVSILSIFQYVAMIIVLYTTSVQPWLLIHFPQISFTIYILSAVVGGAIVMAIAYVIGAPSQFSYWNSQVWKHNNPLRDKLERIEDNQKKIMDKLGIQEDKDAI